MENVQDIIKKLNLQPHPEGGYFCETYRSAGGIEASYLGGDFSGDRNYCTAIYFLLTSEAFSAFHKINQDEIWHFHKGAPIKIHMISPDGHYSNVIMGSDIENDEHFQFVVPAKYWFAAEVLSANSYSLVGCTVSPGFDFRDFNLAKRSDLISQFPEHETLITQFTRE